ncbi:response regulator [Paenibacillus sp. y28]|uniref:response regulator n=1 Tax=Paenibacillus sp. y28 TaxID=3129110 RepID=UPI0030179411
MKAILIDDEKPAITHLERLLRKDGRIEIAGKYNSAIDGLEHLREDPAADVVFLDIEMPEMNGLEAGEYIQQLNPEIRIVYITAYSEYAIEAFELHALDYLLKPVHPERFGKTLDRIQEFMAQRTERAQTTAVRQNTPDLLCFGRLSLSRGAHKQLKWRTHKTQELFAYLLHHKGRWLTKGHLLEVLWPEYIHDKAVTHLHTCVYQIRKQLKESGLEMLVEFAQESYRLTSDQVVTDVEQFEQSYRCDTVNSSQQLAQVDRILSLYRGDYLEEHDYAWVKSKKRDLLQRYMQLSLAAAGYELRNGQQRQAVRRLNKLQEKEPYSDEICRLLLTAYAGLNDYASLQAHYESFAALLASELQAEPEQLTKERYMELRKVR